MTQSKSDLDFLDGLHMMIDSIESSYLVKHEDDDESHPEDRMSHKGDEPHLPEDQRPLDTTIAGGGAVEHQRHIQNAGEDDLPEANHWCPDVQAWHTADHEPAQAPSVHVNVENNGGDPYQSENDEENTDVEKIAPVVAAGAKAAAPYVGRAAKAAAPLVGQALGEKAATKIRGKDAPSVDVAKSDSTENESITGAWDDASEDDDLEKVSVAARLKDVEHGTDAIKEYDQNTNLDRETQENSESSVAEPFLNRYETNDEETEENQEDADIDKGRGDDRVRPEPTHPDERPAPKFPGPKKRPVEPDPRKKSKEWGLPGDVQPRRLEMQSADKPDIGTTTSTSTSASTAPATTPTTTTTPAPKPATPTPAPTTPTPATPTPKPLPPITETPGFKPAARLRNMPTGAGGKGYGTRYGGSDDAVKPKAAFSAPQHGPGSEPRGIGTRIRDVAQNTMYATGIKNPAKQPVEERARVGRKERVMAGERGGSVKNRGMKNVRQAGQVSPQGVIHYPRDTGQYLKSLDESLEKSIDILKIWGSVDRVIPKTELDIDLVDDISILKSFELEETTNIEDLVEGTLVHKMLVDRANRPTSDWWESSMSIAKSINNIDEPAFLSAYLYYDPDTFVLEDFIDLEKAEITRGKPQDLEMMPNTSGGSAIDGLGMSADGIELCGPKDEDCDK